MDPPVIKDEIQSPDVKIKQELNDADGAQVQVDFTALHGMSKSHSIQSLRSATNVAKIQLANVEQRLQDARGNPFIEDKLRTIKVLLQIKEIYPYVLGVVGGTGNGKSTLINTLLSERKLVPTNSARACTAVITEISWNASNDRDKLYIAVIHFISAADWKADLDGLQADLRKADGTLNPDAHKSKTEAGKAMAKVSEVYPDYTPETFLDSDTSALVSHPKVSDLLGATRTISASNANDFRRKISLYIDSKDRSAESDGSWAQQDDKASKVKKGKKTMSLWPLISKVQIFAKAPILENGLVLVDLPGSADSNAARNAIAGDYIKNCSGIWVVAQTHRAVDDKTAQDLLGENFRLQIKLDGNYNNVTLVCSKSDDILPEDSYEQFGLEDEHTLWEAARARLDTWELTHTARWDKTKESLHEMADEVSDGLEQWSDFRDRLQKGYVVKMPPQYSAKRKASSVQHALPTKRARRGRRIAEGTEIENDSGQDEIGTATTTEVLRQALVKGPDMPPAGDPLNETASKSMILHLEEMEKRILREMKNISDERDSFQAELAERERDVDDKFEDLRLNCIRKRNEFVKREARQQFGIGLSEMAQFEAEQDDPDAADPDADAQDYHTLASMLPVFCVSTHLYHEATDVSIENAELAELSEIPTLAAHAKKLTEQGQIRHGSKFLVDVLSVLNSLKIWATDQAFFRECERIQLMQNMSDRLDILRKVLNGITAQLVQKCEDKLEENIVKSLRATLSNATHEVVVMASTWPRTKTNPIGLPYATYNAVVRRCGVFGGKLGFNDFNEDLVAPMRRHLLRNWDATFSREIPDLIKKFLDETKALIARFHDQTVQDIQSRTSSLNLSVLFDQLKTRNEQLEARANDLKARVQNGQREASRKLTPAVKVIMADAYSRVENVTTGPGKYKRMQDTMTIEVNSKARDMLASAAQHISAEFAVLVTHIATDARRCTTETLKSLEQDITNTFGDTLDETEEDMERIASTKENLIRVLAKIDEQSAAAETKDMKDEAAEQTETTQTEPEGATTDDDQGEKRPEMFPTDPEIPMSI